MLKKSHSGIHNHLDYFIYICLCFYLVIDSMTGYFLMTGGPSVSVIYKPFILLLMILSVSSKNVSVISFVAFTFMLMFVVFFTHIVSQNNWSMDSLSMPLQLIMNQVYFIYFYLFFRFTGKIEGYVTNKFLKINIFIFIFNIIIGIFGFGFYTYPQARLGIKGFFYAGNQVSVLFLCLYYIVLSRMTYKKWGIVIVYVTAFIISILIMTRVAVIACVFLTCVDYYLRSFKRKKFYVKLFFPIIVIVLGVFIFNFLPETQFYQHAEYNIMRNMARGQTLIEAISSGRIEHLRDNIEMWQLHSSPSVIMFGLGPTVLPRGVEIDLFDTFFYLGALFTVLVLSYYLALTYLSIRIRNIRLFLFNLFYLATSLAAGHVWFSVMAGLFYAFINAYELSLYYSRKGYNGKKALVNQ